MITAILYMFFVSCLAALIFARVFSMNGDHDDPMSIAVTGGLMAAWLATLIIGAAWLVS